MIRKIFALFFVLSLFIGMSARAEEGIKIGVETPLTGSGATPGHLLLWGFQIAADEINAKGGVLGKKIIPVIRDDESQVQKAITNVKELIYNEKVCAIFGPLNSGSALAIVPIVQQEKVPVMFSVATATRIIELSQNAPNSPVNKHVFLQHSQATARNSSE